jgi:proline iminopeptidase
MKRAIVLLMSAVLLEACAGGSGEAPAPAPGPSSAPAVAQAEAPRPSKPSRAVDYFDNTGRDDVLGGGVRRIPIKTPKGTFTVWTKRVGNNPTIKVLLLHGGPASTHEYFEAMDSYFPGAGIEYYYYDQLGSLYSDQPKEPSLWTIPRFVDEVEQVRQALGLNKENFYLLGHSWGGMLAIEYALVHQQHIKGLIISNMMASIPAYNEYAEKVLMAKMDQKVLATLKRIEKAKDYDNPRYMELLMEHHYTLHVLRMPADKWPDPAVRGLEHINKSIYIPMQGPSELGASGTLAKWDRTADLGKIEVPTLVIGAEHDTMDPKHMKMMAGAVKRGRYLYCPNGSHMAMYDDQETYMSGVIQFVRDVDAGKF